MKVCSVNSEASAVAETSKGKREPSEPSMATVVEKLSAVSETKEIKMGS